MIELHNVTKVYGTDVTALDRLSFTVEKGEFVFLTGPSGAGKSTLLRLLLRQEIPTEGTIAVGGRDLAVLTRSETFSPSDLVISGAISLTTSLS